VPKPKGLRISPSVRIIETKYANFGRPLPPCMVCDQEINRTRDRQVVVTRNVHTTYRHVSCAVRVGVITLDQLKALGVSVAPAQPVIAEAS
jgi:hypothetical protein